MTPTYKETGSETGVAGDEDGDGLAANTDCDDFDPAVHPEAEETCNGVDDDCDRLVDDACRAAPSGTSSLADADAILDGTEPGTWTGYAASAGQGEAQALATVAISAIDPWGIHCSLDRVYLYDSAPSDGALGPDDAIAHLRGTDVNWYFGEWFDSEGDLNGAGVSAIVVDGHWFFDGPLAGDLTTDDADIRLYDYPYQAQYTMFATTAGTWTGTDSTTRSWPCAGETAPSTSRSRGNCGRSRRRLGIRPRDPAHRAVRRGACSAERGPTAAAWKNPRSGSSTGPSRELARSGRRPIHPASNDGLCG